MKLQRTVSLILSFFTFLGSDLVGSWAHAEPLSESDLGSTLSPQCDLCWNPSSNKSAPGRLPTSKYHRPRRPPDSRPHRIPKGGYKLVPNKKQTRASVLRARARHQADLLNAQRIVVIDGDTIQIGAERIKLCIIETPELSDTEGQVTKERLEELLRSRPICIVSWEDVSP